MPGRTGSAIKPDVAIQLAKDYNNIVGIKEASGNIHNVEYLIKNRPDGFHVYSGDDGIAMLCNFSTYFYWSV